MPDRTSFIRISFGFVLLLAVIPVQVLADTSRTDCADSVSIGDRLVPVPQQWCGHLVDSSLLATSDMLVKLPSRVCYDNYKIYMRPEARDAFVKMADAALTDHIRLIVKSAYRSNAFQQRLIRKRLDSGSSLDDIFMKVAPPGYSEHETGLAVDLHSEKGLFAHSDAYKWLKRNAARFGFAESYPKNGFLYWEPWHFCYKPQTVER